MMHFQCLRHLVFAALVAIVCSSQAWAESKEVRFADQPGGFLYVPLHVVIDQKLIEKYAAKAGLGEVKVTKTTMTGGAAMNDALLSGNLDFVIAGIAPLLTIWDKTKGRNDVKAIMAIAAEPLEFVSSDPRVKTINDILNVPDHRIAVPAIRTSMQSVILQMVADKNFGDPFKFDPLTVSMPHPDALAAVLGGKSAVKTHGATLPFSYLELHAKDKATHLVLNSYDVVGPHTLVVMYNTRKWKEENPKLFQAVYDAFQEAFRWINADLHRAAKFYKEFDQPKLDLAQIDEIITDKAQMFYDPAPQGTMKFAEFMHKTKMLNNMPSSWKDYMWEPVHALNGN